MKVQGDSVAIHIHAVALDGADFFTGLELEEKFFFDVNNIASCCAPVAPHVAIPEKK